MGMGVEVVDEEAEEGTGLVDTLDAVPGREEGPPT